MDKNHAGKTDARNKSASSISIGELLFRSEVHVAHVGIAQDNKKGN